MSTTLAFALEAAEEIKKGVEPPDDLLDTIGEILMIIGASFALLAGIGVHKFDNAYSRMHAAAKSPTLGLVLAAAGAALRIRTGIGVGTLVLVAVLQLLTSPVSTHVAARAVHLRLQVRQHGPDELARDERAEAEAKEAAAAEEAAARAANSDDEG